MAQARALVEAARQTRTESRVDCTVARQNVRSTVVARHAESGLNSEGLRQLRKRRHARGRSTQGGPRRNPGHTAPTAKVRLAGLQFGHRRQNAGRREGSVRGRTRIVRLPRAERGAAAAAGKAGDSDTARTAVHLHMLAQRTGMRVALVAATNAAVVRFVGRMNVRVLLAVRRVGEASVAAVELALEGFLACKQMEEGMR